VKFDGHRLPAHIQGVNATLYPRKWSRFGPIASARRFPAALAALSVKAAVLDGEWS
jgi:ATP-dependent DNA ligase